MIDNNEKPEEAVNYVIFPVYDQLEQLTPRELMEVRARVMAYDERITRELRKHQQR